jgi:hypothetical protein
MAKNELMGKNNGKNLPYINQKKLVVLMKDLYKARKNLLIEGPIGCGKSSNVELTTELIATLQKYPKENIKVNATVDDWKDEKNFCLNIIPAAQLDLTDSKGIPKVSNEGLTIFHNTELFPTVNWAKAKGVLFFDELGNTKPEVQSALQPIFVNRKVNNIPLADVWIVAATNSLEDKSNVEELSMALCNRFAIIETGYLPANEWVDLMTTLKKPLVPSLAAFFMSIGADYMATFDPNSGHKLFATPRSIMNANETIIANNYTELNDVVRTISIFCGLNVAEKFKNFFELTLTVDIDAIIKDPKKIKDVDGNNSGLLYSVIFNLIDRVKTSDKVLPNVLQAMGHNEYKDFNMLGLRMLLNFVPTNKMVTEVTKVPELKAQMPEFMAVIRDVSSMN